MYLADNESMHVLLISSKHIICLVVVTSVLLLLSSGVISEYMYVNPHISLRKIKVTICNHQADSQLYMWPDVLSGDLKA